MTGSTQIIVGIDLLSGLLVAGAVMWNMRRLRRPGVGYEPRCKCGYLTEGLEIPRCPECGRMIGFDKTPEELGLSVAEMEEHVKRKKAGKVGMTNEK